MNGVPVKKAIQTGEWYECLGQNYEDEEIRFRLRILGFDPTTVREIDAESDVEVEGVLWLMSVEVVSLCKQPIDAYHVPNLMRIVDHDDFVFMHFRSDLDHDKASGIHRFSGWSDNLPLSPKIKAIGTIPFVLPDEDAEYRLAIKDGHIREA